MDEQLGFAITVVLVIAAAIGAWQNSTPDRMAREPFIFRAAYVLLFIRGALFVAKDLLHLI